MDCIVLDDEPLAIQLIRTYIEQTPGITANGYFTNPDLASERLAAGDIDLLFLDIQMPDMSGLAFLKALPHPPMVIFTTAHPAYAVEGFNLAAIDYLLKPFDFQRFSKAVNKAAQWKDVHRAAVAEPYIFVKSGYAKIPVKVSQIIFLEGFDDYVKIYIDGQSKPILTLSSLKKLLEQLPGHQFQRVHRSFAVAIDKIQAFRRNTLHLEGGMSVPVGETFSAMIKKHLQ